MRFGLSSRVLAKRLNGDRSVTEDISGRGTQDGSSMIIQMLQSVYGAVKAVSLYPPESPVLAGMVDSARDFLVELIPPDGSLELSVIEDKFLINGQILDVGLQKHAAVRFFQEMMKARLLKSITFWEGLKSDELKRLLSLLGEWAPAVVAGQSVETEGLPGTIRQQYMELGEHIYIAFIEPEIKRKVAPEVEPLKMTTVVESEQPVVSVPAGEDVLTHFLKGELSLSDAKDAIIDLASRPDEMLEAVRGFVSGGGRDTDAGAAPLPDGEELAVIRRMMAIIDLIEDPGLRGGIKYETGKVASSLGDSLLVEMLLDSLSPAATQSGLSSVLLPLLSDEKLTALVISACEEYVRLYGEGKTGGWPSARMIALESMLSDITGSAEGELSRVHNDVIESAGIEVPVSGEARARGVALAKSMMAGADAAICDASDGPTLVEAASYLFANENYEFGDTVIGILTERYRSQNEECRVTAAEEISRLFQALEQQGVDVSRYELFDEVFQVSILEPSREIESPRAEATAVDVPSETLALEREEAEPHGAKESSVEGLIDFSAGAPDDETLASVAQVIIELGEDPVPMIAARLGSETDVAQITNLVKLTSMVGGGGCVSIFNPLLVSDSMDICNEVMRALGKLGGKQALQMVLFGSAYVDPRKRAVAVEELGKFKDYLAVRRLMQIIAPRKRGENPEDESVMIAACSSLGELGAIQAVPALGDLCRGGKHHGAYSDGVRAAAARALGRIGGAEAKRALRGLTKDPSELVRSTAQNALGGKY